MLDDLPTLYRLHFEHALEECGIKRPEVTEAGEVTGHDFTGDTLRLGPKLDLLADERFVPVIGDALAIADAVTGATIGHELLQSLADKFGGEAVEPRVDELLESHGSEFPYLCRATEYVARRLDAQLRGEDFAGWAV